MKTENLLLTEILKHQILEEMKYKAPVEITRGLIEKISFLSSAMKESSTFVETSSEIVDDFDKREEKLDEIGDKLDNPGTHFENLKNAIKNNAANDPYPNTNNFSEVVKGFDKYESTNDEVDTLNDLIASNERKISNAEERIARLTNILEEEERNYTELEWRFVFLDFDEELDVYLDMSETRFNELQLDRDEKDLLRNLRGTKGIIDDTEDDINQKEEEKNDLEAENEEMEELIETILSDAEDYEENVKDLLEMMEDDAEQVKKDIESMIEKIED